MYVYNYLAYERMEPTFNHFYNILREEANVDQPINWLSKIPQKNGVSHWMLAEDGGT